MKSKQYYLKRLAELERLAETATGAGPKISYTRAANTYRELAAMAPGPREESTPSVGNRGGR